MTRDSITAGTPPRVPITDMTHRPPLPRIRNANIRLKLERALIHIGELERQTELFARSKPYTVRVRKDARNGAVVGRLVAVKNPAVGPPDPTLALLAGEALHQLRSALDHKIHDLIIQNRKSAYRSRTTQFPIFVDGAKYKKGAPAKIQGVSRAAAAVIESMQPYNRTPDDPTQDPLWILQDLNNTDKHRFVSATVIGLRGARLNDRRGTIGTISSPDIQLRHHRVFFSFTHPEGHYDEMTASLDVAVAFKDAMQAHGTTHSMHDMLLNIATRVYEVIEALSRPRRSKG